MSSVLEEIREGVDLALIRQVAEGQLSDAALAVILGEEADPTRSQTPRLTISLLNIIANIASGSLPLRASDKAFFVPRSNLVHRLLDSVSTRGEFAAKSRLLRRDLDLVRTAAQLMVHSD